MNKWMRIFFEKGFLFDLLVSRNLLFWLSDEAILKKQFKCRMGTELNLENPQTFNEKLQWLKLYDHNPEYTRMVDKNTARGFIAERVGEQYVVPALGVWERFDDIDFDSLPEQFVLKCNHDSGGLVICKDKKSFNREAARKKITKCLKRNYYYVSREWPYKGVKPRIIAEPFLADEADGELRDYKFFTFGGKPKILYITQGSREKHNVAADFFDMDFNHLELTMDHENGAVPPHPPKNFELMQELAEKLCAGTPELRVDFYEVNGRVYVGELTFFHCTGNAPVHPEAWALKLGQWIKLPEKRV